jgi:hypothetical protein
MKTMKNKNIRILLIISFLVSILSACCALLGFLDENLYGSVISTGVFKLSFMVGTISQDMVTIASSVIMMIFIVLYLKQKDMRLMISIIGLLSFYFYAYGTYVISALYTSLYPVYMLIFTLSLLGMIVGVSGFSWNDAKSLYLPRWIRNCSIIFLLLIILIFTSKWIADVIPYTQNHTVPDFYAVYILDLCIVMPCFGVIIYMLLKNLKFAYILLGIALLKTATLILSVAIGSLLILPVYGTQNDLGMIFVYCSVTAVSIILFVFYCTNLNLKTNIEINNESFS